MSEELKPEKSTAPGFTESKKCTICGNTFSIWSSDGNPYKWCPQCRAEKFDELESVALSIRISKDRRRK